MSSSDPGKLTLTSITPGVQLAVLDSRLRSVTSTSNWHQEDLVPGVYMVEAQIGTTTTRHLITVRPGSDETLELSVDFAAAAPIPGLRTTNETHADLAYGLSSSIAKGVGPDAGIVVILRNLPGPDPSLLRTDLLELLDSRFNSVPEMSSDWTRANGGQAVGRANRLAPGPYVLRTTRYNPTEPPEIPQRIDQTIWLSPGWQTLVFIPNTPLGPDPRGLSVQMTHLGRAWQPNDSEAAATEAALAGLRDGTASIDQSTTDLLLHGKFENPMLGILGLHTLMLGRRHPDPSLVQMVVNNLRDLVGDHPDVLALATTLPEDARVKVGVSWPPMLERSYRTCLLPADQDRPGVLQDHSPAQRIAPLIRIPGPWLRWTAAEDIGVLDDSLESYEPTFAANELVSWRGSAIDRVLRAVSELAAFREGSSDEVVRSIGVTEIARRAGLPEPFVASTIRWWSRGREPQ